jgi:hypothetical protein
VSEIEFEDVFKEVVEEVFENFGVSSRVMLKDLEDRLKMRYTKWWKKPAGLDEALTSIYGVGGKSIEESIVQGLKNKMGLDTETDSSFEKTVKDLAQKFEDMKKKKGSDTSPV